MTQVGEPRRQGHWWWVKGAMSSDLVTNGLTLSLQVSLTVAEAMRHRWRPLGNNLRGTTLTSDQEALTYHIYMLLSYSVTWSLQQPVMEMHRQREKTRSFQDANSWLMAKRWSFQETVREVSNKPIHLRSLFQRQCQTGGSSRADKPR